MYFTGNCRVRVLNSVKPYKDTGRTTRNLVAQVVHRFFCMKSHRLPNPRQYRCVCAYIRTIATDKNLYKATVFFFFFFFSCFFTPPPLLSVAFPSRLFSFSLLEPQRGDPTTPHIFYGAVEDLGRCLLSIRGAALSANDNIRIT